MSNYRKIFLLAAFLPMAAFAAPAPDSDWHRCATDADCVVVQGICGKASVTRGYEADAARYYAQEAKRASCQREFWRPKEVVARCRLESCEVIGKQ
ncbi:MAG: hypothetical protein ACKVOE_10755 [Rickettsiales bacterium]